MIESAMGLPNLKFKLGESLMVIGILAAVGSLVASYYGTKVIGELQLGSTMRVAAALIGMWWTIVRIEENRK